MLDIRSAGPDDVPLLARMNEQLIIDQRHENPMRGQALAERMHGWLTTGPYTAALGTVEETPAMYALWRPAEDGGIHLRQFFVAREFRRRGLGRAAIELLRAEHWPDHAPISLDVLVGNQRALDFWRSVGFRACSITMRQ